MSRFRTGAINRANTKVLIGVVSDYGMETIGESIKTTSLTWRDTG